MAAGIRKITVLGVVVLLLALAPTPDARTWTYFFWVDVRDNLLHFSESTTVYGSYGWIEWFWGEPGWAGGSGYYTQPVSSGEPTATPPESCGDDRDALIQEYISYHYWYTPFCESFVSDVYFESDYSFTEWDHSFPHRGWAILRDDALVNVWNITMNAGVGIPELRSGYRNPAKNSYTPGADPQSPHVAGMAADLAADEYQWFALMDAAIATTPSGCIEPRAISPTWFHVDYRPMYNQPCQWNFITW